MATRLDRLRGRIVAAATRGHTHASGTRARIDTAWLLTDGSVCVDGWHVEPDGGPGPIDARVVQSEHAGAWSSLLRKARPDVAAHVFGADSRAVDFGFIGRVDGHVDPEHPASVELRCDRRIVRCSLPDLRRDAVPEEIFAGAVIDHASITPQSLAPIVDVVRWSHLPSPVAASVAYRHPSHTGSARVGVVVPVYGNDRYLRNLLRTLADEHSGVELTVVCDDPDLAEDLVEWTRAWNDSLYQVPMQVVIHDSNAGFAAACNTGWRATTGEVVLLLNSDVLVHDGRDVGRLADGLGAGIAATAPVLLFPDGSLQHAGMEMVDDPDYPGFVLPTHPGKHRPADQVSTAPFDVPMLTGAALCLRRDDLADVGGVPAVFGRGDFEDVLLSLSLRDRGRLVVDPQVRWTHVEGASYRRDALGGVAVTLAKSVVVAELTGGRR